MVEDDSVAIIDSRATLPEFMYRQGMSLRSIIESYKDVSREIIARTVKARLKQVVVLSLVRLSLSSRRESSPFEGGEDVNL